MKKEITDKIWVPYKGKFFIRGALAQLVERNNGIVEVNGSIPLRSKNKLSIQGKPCRYLNQ